jgi:hypothetical protein
MPGIFTERPWRYSSEEKKCLLSHMASCSDHFIELCNSSADAGCPFPLLSFLALTRGVGSRQSWVTLTGFGDRVFKDPLGKSFLRKRGVR